jgi:hypothetical protein
MARVNCGINPSFLSDQHLIAESVEITMITGALRKDGYKIKGKVPDQYCLGKGHINFFKPKIIYLRNRLEEVNEEMKRRGFNPGTKIDLTEFSYLCRYNFSVKDWKPCFQDTALVRTRIIERLKEPKKAKPGFHKYYGKPIEDMDEFCNKLKNSELYFV